MERPRLFRRNSVASSRAQQTFIWHRGGTDPSTIVWCAPSFREEHRAALDWLNEHPDEDTRFFGVEIAAVRIDDSRPAPLFRIVAKPNDWTKQVHTERTSVPLTPKSLAYQEFWNDLLGRIRTEHPTWTRSIAASAVPDHASARKLVDLADGLLA